MRRKSLSRRNRYLIIWLGVIPLLLAFAAYWTSSQNIKSVRATLATANFIQRLDELLSTVQDAETGQRGYLLTGSPKYLVPFQRASKNIESDLDIVSSLAAKAGIEKPRIDDLRRLVEAKMKELQITVDLTAAKRPNEALAVVQTDRGQRLMNEVRRSISQLKAGQTAAYSRRFETQQRSQRSLGWVLACGVTLAFLLLFLSYRFSLLYARDRDLTEYEIRQANEQLESRVRERTSELEFRTKQLELRAVELQRSNADLAQFAYIASHDLQEPLRMVSSYMSMLSRRYKGSLDETADKYIDFAVSGASRMQTLINDLLSYSRAGTQAIEKKQIDLAAVCANVLTNLQVAIAETGASIECSGLPVLFADEVKIGQVIQNLLGNAIKFRKPDSRPRIEFSAKRLPSEWLFQVSDNGIGFDPKYRERIFQVFQRLHGLGKYAGNGIGLAISRRIVEHHGGRLWAESQPGIGSQFYFTLPI